MLCLFHAALIIKELEKWGSHRFAAIVTDNAANMVSARTLVLNKFTKMVEVRCANHTRHCSWFCALIYS